MIILHMEPASTQESSQRDRKLPILQIHTRKMAEYKHKGGKVINAPNFILFLKSFNGFRCFSFAIFS